MFYPSSCARYLGLLLDEHLTWNDQVDKIKAKLNKGNAMLSKVRHHVNKPTLRSIYYAIFHSYLSYGCLSWGHNNHSLKKILTLQKKALRLMNFAQRNSPSSPLFKDDRILKVNDQIYLNAC